MFYTGSGISKKSYYTTPLQVQITDQSYWVNQSWPIDYLMIEHLLTRREHFVKRIISFTYTIEVLWFNLLENLLKVLIFLVSGKFEFKQSSPSRILLGEFPGQPPCILIHLYFTPFILFLVLRNPLIVISRIDLSIKSWFISRCKKIIYQSIKGHIELWTYEKNKL